MKLVPASRRLASGGCLFALLSAPLAAVPTGVEPSAPLLLPESTVWLMPSDRRVELVRSAADRRARAAASFLAIDPLPATAAHARPEGAALRRWLLLATASETCD